MKKKMKKTFSLWLCVLLFAAGLPLGAQAASFYDVPSIAWYSQAVNSLADQGIVSGTGGGNYSPKATLTRAAFVTMLAFVAIHLFQLFQRCEELLLGEPVHQLGSGNRRGQRL